MYGNDCGPACCWMIMCAKGKCVSFRKWANRLIINNDFSYIDFLQSIDGNIADGLWTVELLKVLKSYDFR